MPFCLGEGEEIFFSFKSVDLDLKILYEAHPHNFFFTKKMREIILPSHRRSYPRENKHGCQEEVEFCLYHMVFLSFSKI